MSVPSASELSCFYEMIEFQISIGGKDSLLQAQDIYDRFTSLFPSFNFPALERRFEAKDADYSTLREMDKTLIKFSRQLMK